METNKKDKRSKLVYAGVIAILIVFFIIGFVYGLSSVLKMEGNYPPAILTEARTPEPKTAEEAVKYLNDAVGTAVSEKPQFASGASFNIDSDSLEFSGDDTVKSSLKYIRDDLNDYLNGSFESHSADFNEDFSSLLRKPAFSAADVEEFTVNYIYYKCASCGVTSDTPKDLCEECGSEQAYLMQYKDDYTITYKLKTDDNIRKQNFPEHSDAELKELVGEQISGITDIKKIEVDYTGLTVTMRINRITDELKSLVYEKDMTVSADGAFTGECAALGNLSLKVNVSENENYSFTWPSITLSAHTKDVEPKGKDNLLATLVFPDASQDGVTWESSDPDLVSVDEDGYFTAGKGTGSAVITATYIFNNKPYVDSCTVNVKFDVESISLNKRKLTLNPGETFTFTVNFSPKKATIQTVKWYSEDESIATVDENGKVTAVKPGTVRVYALSDDLYFRGSCEVTVNE